MSQYLEVSHLDYTYPDGTPALFDINVSIGEQEFVALIGQNGSGKTTLSKCMNGLFKPTSGSVIVDGIDTRGKGVVKQLVTRIGYVFQNPDHQLFNDSVQKEIAYGPRNINLSAAEVKARVDEAAKVAGVSTDLYTTHPFFLPKGLRQRVAIASILALKPRTIIVDEPTTGQDMRQSIEVMEFLESLWQAGHTIIIVTHEMSIVAHYARRVIALRQGRVLLDDTTRAVFAQPDMLRQTYVEPPQITRVAQRLDGLTPRDILTVEEMQDAFRSAVSRIEKKG
ncbi:MAG: ATP-binding cassette domain-containing protein [Chloroflexi bacterium]|nr:ATP-binding cassette domain-containing protein [Chloroflexota bacterium]MCL5274145.1 ATP-binding cassette domain-containing protein [Chloroflexota bacterium]